MSEPGPLRRTLGAVSLVYALLVLLAALDGPLPVSVVHRDSLEYVKLASNLAEHGVFGFEPALPTARRELLYPLFLAGFIELGLVTPFETAAANFWPVLAVQAALYLAALAMLAARARRLVPEAVVRTSIVLGAAYFPLAKYAFQVLSEALTIALVSALFFVLSRRDRPDERPRLGLAALLLGLLGLLKSVMLPVAPLIAGFSLRARRLSWLLAIAFTLLALVLPAAWALRNHSRFDQWIVSTTDGASSLYRGNMTLGYQPPGWADPAIPDAVRAERTRLGPSADAYLVELTKKRALESPGEFTLQLFYKLFVLWVGDPRSSDGPVVFGLRCLLWLLIVSRLPLLFRSQDPDARLVLLFALYLSAIYTLLLTNPRYFAPAIFLLLPVAASGLHAVFSVVSHGLARQRA